MSMSLIDNYISYVSGVRRYSPRTVAVYSECLSRFASFAMEGTGGADDSVILSSLTPGFLRSYEVHLLEGDPEHEKLSPRTVCLHMSVISGFCRYLIRTGMLKGNPAAVSGRPKSGKRLPVFYRGESMDTYFLETEYSVSSPWDLDYSTKAGMDAYKARLRRLIVSMLYSTGVRRSELISLDIKSADFSRQVLHVRGKGDKMREIPLTSSLCNEICLYLLAAESMTGCKRAGDDPLLISEKGLRLYPVYVDRAVKRELGDNSLGITGRKSPHVLRHTIATQLLDDGADLNAIKEMLGHSSLAATQVYTHTTIGKLKSIYNNAHPRAKNGGKNGD